MPEIGKGEPIQENGARSKSPGMRWPAKNALSATGRSSRRTPTRPNISWIISPLRRLAAALTG